MNNFENRYNAFPYKKLQEVYLTEIRGLMHACSEPDFDSIIIDLANYEKFLISRKKIKSPLKPILDASNGKGILSLNSISPHFRRAIYTAITASCCELLNGDTLLYKQLQPEIIEKSAMQAFPSQDKLTDTHNFKILAMISSMDAIKTILILRSLGLVTRTSQNINQISLGAGSGNKDIFSIHISPSITMRNMNGQKQLTFSVKQEQAKDIILIDADPIHKDYYASMNENESLQVTAYNQDTIETLKELSSSGITNRNLVTMLRIDHRMLPDVPKFLQYLASIIGDNCDFIMSIGLGDSIEDFKGRVNKVEEVFNALESAKLRPVILKMHKDGSVEDQWASLAVGHPSLATYQILYCKLKRKALSKVA